MRFQGIPTGLIGVTRDITSRKFAAQALAERNLLLALAGKSARVGSFTLDAAADVMQVSDGYVAVHGLPEGTKETTAPNGKPGCTRRTLLSSRRYVSKHSASSGANILSSIGSFFPAGRPDG